MIICLQGTMDSNHWVGSNRIAANSTAGVVDENTKVFNTNNLVRTLLVMKRFSVQVLIVPAIL